MGSGSSSTVEPFKHSFTRSESGNSSRGQFPSDAVPNPEHPFWNNVSPHSGIIGAGEVGDPAHAARNVSEIDHSDSGPYTRQDITSPSSGYPRIERRQDSQRNPFEIETEASDRLSITHANSYTSPQKEEETRERLKSRPSETWANGESFGPQGMAWNHEAGTAISADVARLPNTTKRISRSRVSHEDSCDEEMGGGMRPDPKLLTSQALSEIDHLLSADDDQRNPAHAFLLNLDRKRDQSVADVMEGRHVSLILLRSLSC